MAIRPISPKEAFNKRHIPDEIIYCVNDLILQNINDQGIATFSQEDVVKAAIKNGFDFGEKVPNEWLDVKEHYERIGWEVKIIVPKSEGSFKTFYIFDTKFGDKQ